MASPEEYYDVAEVSFPFNFLYLSPFAINGSKNGKVNRARFLKIILNAFSSLDFHSQLDPDISYLMS